VLSSAASAPGFGARRQRFIPARDAQRLSDYIRERLGVSFIAVDEWQTPALARAQADKKLRPMFGRAIANVNQRRERG
jgi:hypothetical protein